MASVLSGNIDDFGVLVDRYQDEFARYARYMTGSEDEAADVIQESLVRAYRALRRCRKPENFKSWLFRIVSNQCKTHLARRRRAAPLAEIESLAAPDDSEQSVETADVRRRVHQALQELPTEQRETLVLKYVEQLSVQEISQLLSASESAVKMRLLRGRAALLAKLQDLESPV